MSDLKLLPCPFCGWGTIVDGGFLHYRCTCSACGASTKEYPTWELAVEAWNRRADTPHRCGDCEDFHICEEYVDPNETFPEVKGGCPAFIAKKEDSNG